MSANWSPADIQLNNFIRNNSVKGDMVCVGIETWERIGKDWIMLLLEFFAIQMLTMQFLCFHLFQPY